MLGISRQTDYATRLVLQLACLKPGSQMSIAEIAKIKYLPVPFVRRLVGQLVKAGILISTRGSGGGVRLARPSGEITLLEVVQTFEGELALNQCVANPKGCILAEDCPGHSAWAGATQVLMEHLASIHFADLVQAQ